MTLDAQRDHILTGRSGSVVTRSLPADVIAVGSPARVLRPITAADKTGFGGLA
ncbi:hypothetical protein FB565_007953 [Actinoplanes lutulentus]|uniref:Uncharacterized protein n=1 Tax=Actinoplanes lutulentus TaxID=1287878 RepID=A0A327Z7R5_9ACTN|nr:hypothetical protein [Actinoplanes lutulentus]MBB2948170.1 hypothetical protein [Actinoplanes lutulentus]RAK31330.1 hypothetical protein B0I29_115136 [Actinoplanes lutulentus]